MKSFNYFNVRTFLILLISQVAVFLTIEFQLTLNLNLLLFSLAIGFPLGFSIQAAFKRRDKALEYFALFKGGMLSLYYTFSTNSDLKAGEQREIKVILTSMVEQLILQLEHHIADYAPFQKKANDLFVFCEKNEDNISNRSLQRIIRYYRDISLSSTYLISLVRHRTMAGLRFYAITFIALFPLVQAPLLFYHMQSMMPAWGFYLLVAFSSLLLVTLNNFQNAIEYPFDPDGMDNIQIHDFKMNLEEASVNNDIRQKSEII
jgi:hypothetical protein